MISDRIKHIREQNGITQMELAKKLGITRSSVNAWEMGISVPSTQYIVELALLFKISTDYLLELENDLKICIKDLSEEEKMIIFNLLNYFDINRKYSKIFENMPIEDLKQIKNKLTDGKLKDDLELYL